MAKAEKGTYCLTNKIYLWIWCFYILLNLLDRSIFGGAAGGLDARPLIEEDHRYLFPIIYCLLGSLFLGSSLRLTTILACLAHAVDIAIRWKRMPIIWDHEQWAIQIELTYLLVFLPNCFTALSSLANAEATFCKIARWQFVVFYAASTFWKFNTGFFDPSVSCGSVLIIETLTTYLPSAVFTPSFTKLVGAISPHATAAVEASIAVTMALKPTRQIAVLLGTVFHLTIFLLPVNSAGGFSMDCTTRFIVFFTSTELQQFFQSFSAGKEIGIAAIVSAMLVALRQKCTGAPFDFAFLGMCFLAVLYPRIILHNANAKSAANERGRAFSTGYHSLVLTASLMLAITYGFLTVILGAQHMGAPTMYSNLRYYGGGNHYLVPVSILPDDLIYGGGLVQIIESTSVALNRRLAHIPSEVVFPDEVLTNIRVATGQVKLPVQFFPFCHTNPHSRSVLAPEYTSSNPVGSKNFMPFILPISDVRRAIAEEADEQDSFIVKLIDAGTSDNFHEVATIPHRIVVLTQNGCEIQLANGTTVDECTNDRAAQLILKPPTEFGYLHWLVSKLQKVYPQLVGLKEDICMS